jgi:predicted amidophosphoribosyltransferase
VLTEIDARSLSRYRHLEAGDRCFYLRDYTPRRGFLHGETNALIWDLKRSPVWRGTALWRWKQRALARLARELARGLPAAWLARATLVPIPPSRVRGDPLYDDRMLAALALLARETAPVGADVRQLVVQTASTRSSSRGERRLSPREIAAVYRVDEAAASPRPRAIGLCDDVLSTGAHFRAAKDLLVRRFPGTEVRGFFFARCMP